MISLREPLQRFWEEPRREDDCNPDDDLAPARGIMHAVLAGLVLWLIILWLLLMII